MMKKGKIIKITIIMCMFLMCGCNANTTKNSESNDMLIKEYEKQKEKYYKLLEEKCINYEDMDSNGNGTPKTIQPDKFAIDDFNGDGILDLLAITEIHSIDRSFYTIFTIKDNEVIRVPFYHYSTYEFVYDTTYFSYLDEVTCKIESYDYFERGYNNHIILNSNMSFYKINNHWLVFKSELKDECGIEKFINWTIFGYESDKESCEKYNVNYIKACEDDKKVGEEILNGLGTVSKCYDFVYDFNNESDILFYGNKISATGLTDITNNMDLSSLDYDTHNISSLDFSKVNFSFDMKTTGENIDSIEKISFIENNIDNRTKYLLNND